MDKDILSGLVKLWRSGTFQYRALLLQSWADAEVAEILKELKVRTALELVQSLRAGVDG